MATSGGVSAEDAPSQGSIGHPFSCKLPCKYHWKKGCKDGKSCIRCHFCPWNPQLGRTGTGNAAGKAKPKAKSEAKPKEKSEATGGNTAPGPNRQSSQNPVTLELEERLNSNSSRYESVPDDELCKLLPRTDDGSLASVGSFLHASGKCSRCTFFTTPKGCPDGIRCKFCHLHHPKKEDGPGKRKRQVDSDSDSEQSRGDGGKRLRIAECDAYGNSRPSWLREHGGRDHRGRDERSSYGYAFSPYGPHYGAPHQYGGPPPHQGAYLPAPGYGAPPPGPPHGIYHYHYGPPQGPPPPHYNPYEDRRERWPSGAPPPGADYHHGREYPRDPGYEQYRSHHAPPPGALSYDYHRAWPRRDEP